MSNCKQCLSEDVCRYNDGHNLWCKEGYDCPKFKDKSEYIEQECGHIVYKDRVLGGISGYECPQCSHKWQKDNRVKVKEQLCSRCGKVLAHNYQNFCPNCGIKLEDNLQKHKATKVIKSLKLYAVRDKNTGKLISDISHNHKKYWDKKACLITAINKNTSIRVGYEKGELELVTFKLTEESNNEM